MVNVGLAVKKRDRASLSRRVFSSKKSSCISCEYVGFGFASPLCVCECNALCISENGIGSIDVQNHGLDNLMLSSVWHWRHVCFCFGNSLAHFSHSSSISLSVILFAFHQYFLWWCASLWYRHVWQWTGLVGMSAVWIGVWRWDWASFNDVIDLRSRIPNLAGGRDGNEHSSYLWAMNRSRTTQFRACPSGAIICERTQWISLTLKQSNIQFLGKFHENISRKTRSHVWLKL